MSEADPTEASTEAESAPGGLKAKLPLMLAIVVGLAVGGGSGAAVIGPMVAKKMGVSAPVAPDSTAGHEGEAEAAKGGEHGKEGESGAAAAPPVLLLENLVLNPASSGGSRYLLMSIAIESTDKASVDALTLRDAELKDLILTTLSRKTVDQLSDVGGRDAIKTELIDAVKERFGKTSIKHLYFPQFVIQ